MCCYYLCVSLQAPCRIERQLPVVVSMDSDCRMMFRHVEGLSNGMKAVCGTKMVDAILYIHPCLYLCLNAPKSHHELCHDHPSIHSVHAWKPDRCTRPPAMLGGTCAHAPRRCIIGLPNRCWSDRVGLCT